MNKIYKVVWSKVRNCYVVVSELAKRNSKGSGSRSIPVKAARGLIGLLLSACLAGGYGVQMAWAAGQYSTEVGNNASAAGDYATAIGNFATADVNYATAIGSFAEVTAIYGVAIGNNASVSGPYGMVFGNNASVSIGYGVALGSNSVATRDKGVAGYDPSAGAASVNTTAVWKSTAGAVSVGDVSKDFTRQITGVAAGSEDTDAVNVAQLKAAIGSGGGATYTAGDGIRIDTTDNNKISVKTGDGLEVDSGALKVKSGKIESDSDAFVKGAALYTELRPESDGTHVKTAQTAAENLKALDAAVENKADKAATLAGYGIGDAYTKTETNNTFATKASVSNKADKATTLAGYGIADAYTKTEADSTFLTQASISNKADKATTLAGYGIMDAYTKEETNSTITTAVAKKADRATTLAGYGITDAYTQAQTNNAISAAVAGKADAATTLAGYGITDAYTKTETDNTFATKASVSNKADKATTLAGYGITNAYTKTETTSAINEAIAVKADKATTLAGYGITDAYTKTEADAAHSELSDRIGTISQDGIIIKADKNLAENLTKMDTALKGQMGKVQDLVAGKAEADASNVGINATSDNSAAWGAALGAGAVADGNGKLVTGGVMYGELRPADGNYVKQGNTTAQNLTALDANLGEVKKSSDNIVKALEVMEAISDIHFDTIIDLADDVDNLTQGIKTINDMNGLVAPQGSSKADEFVRGYTVYNEVRPANGAYVKKDNTTAENLTALDKQVKTNADNIGLKANAADVYTKTETDGKFAQKANTLSGYGITDAYTKTEVDNAVGAKADKSTTLQGYGITDAYTRTEVDDAIGGKADKATTLQGYGITNAYTKDEVDTSVNAKADKATTLQGYGITDAYTKKEADNKFLTQASIDNKADKATTLAGYGIKDAFTKEETASAISSAISNKADKAETLEGYGIKDAYTKTATDNAISSAVANKADRASTLEGYGIKDAFTKEETTSAISSATANKAEKATTLQGYGITDAYTKNEADAANTALSNRIGTIDKDGLIIKADKNVAENLALIDNALQDQTGIAKELLNKKADTDASNVGKNAKAQDGSAADNSAAWGSALGTGAVESGNGKLVTGDTVYSEVRPDSDGEYVKKDKTTSANLKSLDVQVKENAGNIVKNADDISANAQNIATNSQNIETNTKNITTAQKTADDAQSAISVLATVAGIADMISYEGIVNLDDKIKELNNQNGEVKAQGEAHADEFIKGSTVYEYLNGKDGEDGNLTLGKNSTKVAIGKGSEAGTNSVALGSGSRVKDDVNPTKEVTESAAIGYQNTVSGDQSVALGSGNTVSGLQSVAIGYKNTVTGHHSGAIGDPNTVEGDNSWAFGNNNSIPGSNTIVLGNKNDVSGNNTFVLGSNVNTNAKNAVVLGDGSAGVDNAVSVGAPGKERQIKNVAPGTEATDAATVGQLQAASQTAYNNAVYLNNSINRVDDKVNKVGAGAAALAALHPIEMDNKFGMGLGYGNYHNASSMAVGLFYRPKDNLMFSIGGSMGNGENMVNAGISIALDKGFTSSKAVMARTIKAQGEALEEQRKANAEQEKKIHNLEAENAAIKEQNARLEARLAAIEARLGK